MFIDCSTERCIACIATCRVTDTMVERDMYSLWLMFAAIWIVSGSIVLGQVTEEPPDIDPCDMPTTCSYLAQKIPDHRDCDYYYECVYEFEEWYHLLCSPGTLFDKNSLNCVHPEDATCQERCPMPSTDAPPEPPVDPCNPPNDCTDGTRAPDPDNCGNYYSCDDGQWVSQTCTEPQLFDKDTLECVDPSEANCQNRCGISVIVTEKMTEKAPTEEPGIDPCNLPTPCETDSPLIPHPGNCSMYSECLFGDWLERSCGPGTLFDKIDLQCYYPQDARCQEPCLSTAFVSVTERATTLILLTSQAIVTSEILSTTGVVGTTVISGSSSTNVETTQYETPNEVTGISTATNDVATGASSTGNVGTTISPSSAENVETSKHETATEATTTGAATTEDDELDPCDLPPFCDIEGPLVPHAGNCSLYYECSFGTWLIRSCGPGTLFDSVSLSCQFPEDVVCQEPCAATEPPPVSPESTISTSDSVKGETTEIVSMNPSRSITKDKMTTVPFATNAAGTTATAVITDKTTTVVTTIEVATGAATTEDDGLDSCDLPPFCDIEGPLVPHAGNCSLYYECSFGTWLIRPCSTGTFFDSVSLSCQFPEDVVCQEPCPTTEPPSVSPEFSISTSDSVSTYPSASTTGDTMPTEPSRITQVTTSVEHSAASETSSPSMSSEPSTKLTVPEDETHSSSSVTYITRSTDLVTVSTPEDRSTASDLYGNWSTTDAEGEDDEGLDTAAWIAIIVIIVVVLILIIVIPIVVVKSNSSTSDNDYEDTFGVSNPKRKYTVNPITPREQTDVDDYPYIEMRHIV